MESVGAFFCISAVRLSPFARYDSALCGGDGFAADDCGTDDLFDTSAEQFDGVTFLRFSRYFNTGDRFDTVLQPDESELSFVYAFHSTGKDVMEWHGPTRGYLPSARALETQHSWQEQRITALRPIFGFKQRTVLWKRAG
jgi:hypothetical protein